MNKFVKIFATISIGVLLHQGAHAHSASSHHDHGLGNYGTEGPIERSQLPTGIAERVSKKSIEIAQSPELATARANWDDELDFVWQIHYQLQFREQTDYLSTKPDYLGKVLNERPKNLGIDSLGLYMTGEEVREFERRQELGDRMPKIMDELNEHEFIREGDEPKYSSNFAGLWQDQKDDGAIVLALIDPSLIDSKRIESIAGGKSNLRIINVKYSWDQVQRYRDALLDTFKAHGFEASVRINSTSKGRIIEVVSPKINDISDIALRVAPKDLMVMNRGSIDVEEGALTSTHAEADQMPGLQIEFDPGGTCTWGINGHTSNWNYLVTAGHCGSPPFEDFTGWTNVMEVHQNNVFHLTPGSRYVSSINTEPYDMKRVSSPQADSNCYHSNGHCIKNVRWRALHNSWEVGSDLVCASLGTTSAYQCGFVIEENYSSNGAGCEGSRWVRYSIDTSGGDSGSGIIGPVASPDITIDAIHACGSGTSGFGNTAYDVKRKLGFDFNCSSVAVTGRSASNWGACPTYNR